MQSLCRKTEVELDDELDSSKYDHKRATGNDRNGHISKSLCTSFWGIAASAHRDRKEEFDPQVIKKNQTSIN